MKKVVFPIPSFFIGSFLFVQLMNHHCVAIIPNWFRLQVVKWYNVTSYMRIECTETKLKTVRALWLAKRRVWMRVCKRGCDVKMFCFFAFARIWKSSWVENSTSLLYLPIPSSAKTWKIFTNMRCKYVFSLGWRVKREKSVFWKLDFLKSPWKSDSARPPRSMKLGNRRKVYLQKYWFVPH